MITDPRSIEALIDVYSPRRLAELLIESNAALTDLRAQLARCRLDSGKEEEWAKLKAQLNHEKWNAGEESAFYSFFLHGWYGRTGEAAYQDASRALDGTGAASDVIHYAASVSHEGAWSMCAPSVKLPEGAKVYMWWGDATCPACLKAVIRQADGTGDGEAE